MHKEKLEDVAEITMGTSPSGDTYNEDGNGLPLLNGPTEFGKMSPNCTLFTTDSKRECKSGDLIFCVRGSTTGRMNWADQVYSLGRGVCSIRGNSKLETKYVKYALDYSLKSLLKLAGGGTFPNLTKTTIHNFEIPFPDSRFEIASILSAFDDLIENNTRRIEILEEMARRIYREWFVHFRYPGHREDELVDSGTELGEIPEGWEVKKLKGFLKFKNGKSPETKAGEEYPVYGSNGIIGKCNESGWEDGIIIGRVGAYCGSVEYCEGKFWGSDNTIVATTREGYDFPLFSYYKLEDLNLRRYAGGSAQPLMTQTVIKDIKTVIPSNKLLEKFSSQAKGIWRFKRNLEKKNKKLKETRDLLLPKLISGDLKLECQ